MQEKWHTDRWFVSSWNYDPSVTSDYKFADKITIHDTTLRDGEQETGVALKADAKIRIAELLAEAGVHRIEAGMPAVSSQDEKAIREIVKRNLGPEIFAFARCVVDDVKRAADCGVDGIIVEIPSSGHLIKYAYNWEVESAVQKSIEATRAAKELGLKTVFFTIDSSRAEMPWLLELIQRVATEGHMDSLTLVDTMGVLSPGGVSYFVKNVQKRFGKIPLEAHFHNDFGLAVANTITALSLGIQTAHTTVLGIGERAGGAALEELVMALKLLYGIDVGVRTERLFELGQTVARLTGHPIAGNKPVVGKSLWEVQSGIPASWLRRCRGDRVLEVFPMRWDLVGQSEARIVLGKGSNDESVREWLEKLGLNATPEQISDMVPLVKAKAMDKNGCLTEEEFREIVKEVTGC